MNISQNISVKSLNSFAIEATCPTVYYPASFDDLKALPVLDNQAFYVLGEGSNTLFVDSVTPVLICPQFKGVDIIEKDEYYQVTAQASENWHKLVTYCIEHGAYGLENLALIPGSVGAAPIQNIGAYGVELADYCQQVTWYDFKRQMLIKMTKEECQFGYRDSIFKQALKGKGIILDVTLQLPKAWQAKLNYPGLDELTANASASEVMAKVINIRSQKLPMPKVLPNAGSFFKNPVVNQETFARLQSSYPKMPYYFLDDENKIKLAAGWLIDQCGLKGFSLEKVSVHQAQALVLVNHDHGSGKDVINLASYVCQQVKNKFQVNLEPEVRLIGHFGEQSFESLLNTSLSDV